MKKTKVITAFIFHLWKSNPKDKKVDLIFRTIMLSIHACQVFDSLRIGVVGYPQMATNRQLILVKSRSLTGKLLSRKFLKMKYVKT